MDNSDFGLDNLDIPVMNFSYNELSFNKYCIEKLGNPEYISIGINRAGKKIAVKAGKKGKGFLCNYIYNANAQCITRLYIKSMKLRMEIAKIIGVIPNQKPLRYIAEFNIQKNMLIVDLTMSID